MTDARHNANMPSDHYESSLYPFLLKRTLSDQCCPGDQTDVSLYWNGCPAGAESRSLAGKTGMWQEWSLSGRGQAVYSQLPWSEKCHQSFFKPIQNHLLFRYNNAVYHYVLFATSKGQKETGQIIIKWGLTYQILFQNEQLTFTIKKMMFFFVDDEAQCTFRIA